MFRERVGWHVNEMTHGHRGENVFFGAKKDICVL